MAEGKKSDEEAEGKKSRGEKAGGNKGKERPRLFASPTLLLPLATADGGAGPSSTSYPPPAPRKGNVTILLFYAYCKPHMTKVRRA